MKNKYLKKAIFELGKTILLWIADIFLIIILWYTLFFNINKTLSIFIAYIIIFFMYISIYFLILFVLRLMRGKK